MRPIKRERTHPTPKTKHHTHTTEDLFNTCVRKGLIEKTEYGYYFTPEFFETLEIYEE